MTQRCIRDSIAKELQKHVNFWGAASHLFSLGQLVSVQTQFWGAGWVRYCHPLLIGGLEVERALCIGTHILHNPTNRVRHVLGKRGTGFLVSKRWGVGGHLGHHGSPKQLVGGCCCMFYVLTMLMEPRSSFARFTPPAPGTLCVLHVPRNPTARRRRCFLPFLADCISALLFFFYARIKHPLQEMGGGWSWEW